MVHVRRRVAMSALLAVGLLAAACGAGSGESGPGAVAGGDDGPGALRSGGAGLTVFAASSLTDALEELAGMFTAEHGTPVVLNLAGSQTLVLQLLEGAAADLVITADAAQMDLVAASGLLAGDPVTVATNRLMVAVEAGNPLGLTSVADLARPDLIVVLPAVEVPAGRYAAELLERAGVQVEAASSERSARAALARVLQGEADATLVYASDVAVTPAVDGVDVPTEHDVVVRYPMANVSGGSAPDAADAFAALLLSERGRAVLTAHGFGPP